MAAFLIADDSDGKTLVLTALVQLVDTDRTIVFAKTTSEAKRLIDEQQIDAAFIDYEMPEEEGPAVIAYLREKNPSAKIALVTAANSETYRNEAMEAGANAYICTSLDSRTVEHNVLNLLHEWNTESP